MPHKGAVRLDQKDAGAACKIEDTSSAVEDLSCERLGQHVLDEFGGGVVCAVLPALVKVLVHGADQPGRDDAKVVCPQEQLLSRGSDAPR
jgi:hypothetical protein